MFINKRQMPHAKYGRDRCIACLRGLGLGYAKISKLLHINKSTAAHVVKRAGVSRSVMLDTHHDTARNLRRSRTATLNGAARELNRTTMEEIRNSVKYWKRYEAAYWRKYRDYLPQRQANQKRWKQNLKHDPERYAAYMEEERIRGYLRRGIPRDRIPARGTGVIASSSGQPVRRRREKLRLHVREVWRGAVGDRAAIRRVGCTVAEFREHILLTMKSGWSESNYGSVWNFDHIIPCAAFDIFDAEDVKTLNHYLNIRACCVVENSVKGARVD